MEILAIIGILILGLLVFVGGGLFGWGLKGLGAVFDFLFKGWDSCIGAILSIISWIILIFLALLLLGIMI